MVKSVLDPKIEYKEKRDIELDDKGYEANIYESEFFHIDVVFAIGQAKTTYLDSNGIVYFPIYLIEDDNTKTQIGLYELLSSEQMAVLDEDNDIDLNKLNLPLFYSYAYSLIRAKSTEEGEEVIVIDDDVEDEDEYDIASSASPSASPSPTLKKSKTKRKWIQKFMDDTNYDIIDTKPDGHCFFYVLQLALKERGQKMSIDEMREILANNITQELYDNYKMIYDNAMSEKGNLSGEIKNITKRHNELEKSIKTKTKDRNLQMSYVKQLDEMKTKHKALKQNRTTLNDFIVEYNFMAGVDSLAMLKLKIKTKDFWAETWAISTLERELNIKVIIMSELNYSSGDIVNVLNCGQLNDTILQEKGIFEPSFYVITCYQGNHYQLITYNEKKSFTFGELPEKVKELVADKCLEKMSGPYSLIPEFMEYQIERNKPSAVGVAAAEEAASVAVPVGTSESDIEILSDESSDLPSDLYDNSTVFRFYIKSADKPMPGKGAGEIIGPEGIMAYKELAKISDWRKKLTNVWLSEFVLDRHRWQSVEHYYQGSKYKSAHPEFYIKFSLDAPDSEFARDPLFAKEVGESKTGMIKGIQYRPKNVKPDADFSIKTKDNPEMTRGEMEMENAIRAKFTQNPDLKKLLLETKRAKLEHVVPKQQPVVFNHLMRIRRELQGQS